MSKLQDNISTVSFPTRLIATGLFSGYAPIAPGTAGSAVSLCIYWIAGLDQFIPLMSVIVLWFFIGTVASAAMERQFGDDPSIVVIDEFVGMWISLLLLPKTLTVAVAAFLLFRLFDIVKPPPARNVEVLKNGWGIMLDDVFAGIYANISLRVLIFIFPSLVGVA